MGRHLFTCCRFFEHLEASHIAASLFAECSVSFERSYGEHARQCVDATPAETDFSEGREEADKGFSFRAKTRVSAILNAKTGDDAPVLHESAFNVILKNHIDGVCCPMPSISFSKVTIVSFLHEDILVASLARL